jgi:hypothetical protein
MKLGIKLALRFCLRYKWGMRVTFTRTQLLLNRAQGYAPGIVPPVDPVFAVGRDLPARVDVLDTMAKAPVMPLANRPGDRFERGWSEPDPTYSTAIATTISPAVKARAKPAKSR